MSAEVPTPLPADVTERWQARFRAPRVSQPQVTDRPNGTLDATLSPDGESVWWFADTDGDEFGTWRVQPFAGGPDLVAVPEIGPAYPAGLEVGRTLAAD